MNLYQTCELLAVTGFSGLLLTAACDGDGTEPDSDDAAFDTANAPDAAPTRDTAGDGGPSEDATAPSDTPAAFDVSGETFGCVLEWTKKRRFYIKNVAGNLDAALEVADSPDGGRYPPGTLIQLVPSEAMFKHRDGWAPQTNNWEFFSLDPSENGTEILQRGTTDVENQFGGNCLECHSKAKPKWDFVCEQDHGCDPLPLDGDDIENIQQNDPRCE